jgi:hypothetical protein
MATFYSTGPVQVWVGPQVISPAYGTVLPTGSIRYLGTAEVSPQAEIRRQYQPAYNDLSGAVPFDLNFLGEDAVIAIDLTRWNETTYAALANAPAQLASPGIIPRGSYPAIGGAGGMGSLQAHDGFSVVVYMVFPYGFPAINNIPGRTFGMPGGYRWMGASLINDKFHQMGAKYRKLHLTFQCAPIFNYLTNNFTLYDNSVPANLVRPSNLVSGIAA